nr:hypothetical protein [Tanacetum cinerariifolium]
MLELKTMNPKAHEWLNKIPPEHWAISHFSVSGKDKPVITLLEYIREYCMKEFPLTPTVTRIMESIKKEDHLMKVQWNGANKIPCKHDVAACWEMDLNDRATPPPKAWVNPCYWLTTWRETYSYKVGRPRKKRKRSKHKDEPFMKDVGQDGSGGSSGGDVIGLSITAGQGGTGGLDGACVGNQSSSYTRWTKKRVQIERISPQKRTLIQPESQPSISSQVTMSRTRNEDGREMGDVSDNGKFIMVDEEDLIFKKISPVAKEIMNFKEPMLESSWIEAMQEEIHEYERLQVWELVPCLDKVMLIKLKWIFKVKKEEFGGVLKNKARLVAQEFKYDQSNTLHKESKKRLITDIPMVENHKLDADLQRTPTDATHNHGMIGSLMYLTSSRPDLSYADTGMSLTTYSDADQAGCEDTRCSTSGSAQFLGDKLVSCLPRSNRAMRSRVQLLNILTYRGFVLKSLRCNHN